MREGADQSMSNKKKAIPYYSLSFGVGVLAGFIGGVIASNRVNAARRMPNAINWQMYLARERGHVEATCLTNRVESRYWLLFCERPPVVNQALRDHLNEQILPVLALYQVLRDCTGDQEAALMAVEEMVAEANRTKLCAVSFIGRFPFFFNLLRRMTPSTLSRNFPPEGWQIEWVENSDKSVAFNIHSCFYLDTLKEYGAPELTQVFCKMDDIFYKDISSSVRWERTGTLARGDQLCDFRWTTAG